MLRPCFLVVDRETPTGISTRKLIIETAKFNVITAYSSHEAIETLRKFPAIDGVVTDSGMIDMACDELLAALKKIKPGITLIVVDTPSGSSCNLADHTINTYDPRKLLECLETLNPEATRQIEEQNQKLEKHYLQKEHGK
jgi:response regulator RpfG family c-di-GMP phosphodiesterase